MKIKITKPTRTQSVAGTVAVAAVLAVGGGGYAVGHAVAARHATSASAAPVSHRWLPDVTPPADPFDLLHGHWPAVSEGALEVLAATAQAPMIVRADGEYMSKVPTAGEVAADFALEAGDTLRPLRVDLSRVMATGASAGKFWGLTRTAASVVRDAKDLVGSEVEAGTIEASALPAGALRDAVVARYRETIAGDAARLSERLISLGQSISTPDEKTDPSGTGVSVFFLQQPGGLYIPVNRFGVRVADGRVVGDHALASMPPSPPEQHNRSTPQE